MLDFFKKRKLERKFEAIASDSLITNQEKLELDSLLKSLGLAEKDLSKLKNKKIKELVKPIVSEIIKARRFSDAQEQELNQIFVNFSSEYKSGDQFEFERKLWLFEKCGKLDLQNIPIQKKLKKDEICYTHFVCRWRLRPSDIGFIPYRIYSYEPEHIRGINKSDGSVDFVRDTSEISDGTIYITNKRVFFVGKNGSTDVILNDVVEFAKDEHETEFSRLFICTQASETVFEMTNAQGEYVELLLSELMK